MGTWVVVAIKAQRDQVKYYKKSFEMHRVPQEAFCERNLTKKVI